MTDADLADLAARVQEAALRGGVSVGLAESCTGGLVTHLLTEVPGASGYLLGGVVSYSDSIKEALLDVPAATIAAHGAVSAQVAVAMAEGGRHRLGCQVAVAVTGIAGPEGGTPAKPVGLTYVAVADGQGHEVRRFNWSGDRTANKRDSARAALELLLERLSNSDR